MKRGNRCGKSQCPCAIHTASSFCFFVCAQALLELWHAGVLKKFDEEKLLVKAEAARL